MYYVLHMYLHVCITGACADKRHIAAKAYYLVKCYANLLVIIITLRMFLCLVDL